MNTWYTVCTALIDLFKLSLGYSLTTSKVKAEQSKAGRSVNKTDRTGRLKDCTCSCIIYIGGSSIQLSV